MQAYPLKKKKYNPLYSIEADHMKLLSQEKLDQIVAQVAAKKQVHGAVVHLQSEDGHINHYGSAGNLHKDSLFYIASINKLFISAITLRLIHQQKLGFSDRIVDFFPPHLLDGLLVFKGKDYTADITVAHLISQTSGLPCYLIDKNPQGKKLMEELLSGKDEAWPLAKMLETVKRMKPHFIPGTPGKAYYTNTNFKIMGAILTKVLSKPLSAILTDFFAEIGLSNTHVIRPENTPAFVPVYAADKQAHLSQYFTSSGYDMLSNVDDLMVFTRAFFRGDFYRQEKMKDLEKWNRVFFPFKYGMGLQQFYIPRILSPFKAVPFMLGHAGSTGTAAFCIPDKKVFITGAINQALKPQLMFQLMVKLLNEL